jgi:hypothetical protein
MPAPKSATRIGATSPAAPSNSVSSSSSPAGSTDWTSSATVTWANVSKDCRYSRQGHHNHLLLCLQNEQLQLLPCICYKKVIDFCAFSFMLLGALLTM